MKPEEKQRYLFLVLYYGNRISPRGVPCACGWRGRGGIFKNAAIQVFHPCAERNRSGRENFTARGYAGREETEDALLKYYDADRNKVSKLPPAFKIKGTPYEPYGNNVLQGVVSVSALKAAAKRSDATITEYLTALFDPCDLQGSGARGA